MSEYFEIAYAAASKGLCLFTGTGFSKAVTGNAAPTWKALLIDLCDLCDNPTALKDALFPSVGDAPLSLEEAAQVIEIELLKKGKLIDDEISSLIKAVDLDGDNSKVEEFCQAHSFQVVTTNYDKLMEKLCGEANCQSLTPGLPIPRSDARVKVYHVHGSVDVPENMVVTANDYFSFLNAQTYFSRKLSTILHENTVVIIGYSLSDMNLKAILSDYKGFAKSNLIGSNIFLVSRSKVKNYIKDYYSNCYGIRVIDDTGVAKFFSEVTCNIAVAKDCIDTAMTAMTNVLAGTHKFKKNFINLENSFFEIVASISAKGHSLNADAVVKMIGKVIAQKQKLTQETGAWEQYTHLAKWLVYLGAIMELKSTSIEDIYLKAVRRSMDTMSKKLILGYSWHAYNVWEAKWPSLMPANRVMIKEYITDKLGNDDAIGIVNLG